MFAPYRDLPASVFVGFFPKITMAAPLELSAFGVEDVASVSECMSRGPEGWIDQWKHNVYGFYDSEDLAVSVIPIEDSPRYDLYAYELFPVAYVESLEPIEVAAAPGPRSYDYELLGYDMVSRSVASFFECSPLSCNMAAAQFAVNAHCLITNRHDAYAAFQRIGEPSSGYEPGPYYLFAVYRMRRESL